MMKKLKLISGLAMISIFISCNNSSQTANAQSVSNEKVKGSLVENVLTKEERDALSPMDILKSFEEGNERFMNNDLTERNHSQQVRKSAMAQFPKAFVLSCVDSRVPVEDVFDRGIGDIFVGRVAGNFVNEDLLGSMEFGSKVAGAKLIVVLGHEHCGAIKSAIADVKLGNITAMLSKIRPVVEKVNYDGERTAENQEFVHEVCEKNVMHNIEQIRRNSPILKEMEDNGELKIVGGIYDMDTGKVTFME